MAAAMWTWQRPVPARIRRRCGHRGGGRRARHGGPPAYDDTRASDQTTLIFPASNPTLPSIFCGNCPRRALQLQQLRRMSAAVSQSVTSDDQPSLASTIKPRLHLGAPVRCTSQRMLERRAAGLPASSSNFLHNILKLPSEAAALATMSDCARAEADSCTDEGAATRLKTAAIGVILLAGALGVLIPLIGRRSHFLRTDGNPFFVAKAFAAGVILATAFVHMLPTAHDTLANPCLPEDPWGKFAWAGFIAMLAALATLIMDFAATEYYMNRHHPHPHAHDQGINGKSDDLESNNQGHGQVMAHPHIHEHVVDDSTFNSVRHIVVAQVFEFGIVAHSIIIGITVGVSSSPCTIRPLFAALTFHQFFEGFALGGCIAQAGFRTTTALIMGLCFAITTPAGIGIGMAIATTYNENSPKALIIQGVFDSVSAGILVYMALVDLIAADFLSKRMRSSRNLQVMAFLALFLGAGCMSLLGVWA